MSTMIQLCKDEVQFVFFFALALASINKLINANASRAGVGTGSEGSASGCYLEKVDAYLTWRLF